MDPRKPKLEPKNFHFSVEETRVNIFREIQSRHIDDIVIGVNVVVIIVIVVITDHQGRAVLAARPRRQRRRRRRGQRQRVVAGVCGQGQEPGLHRQEAAAAGSHRAAAEQPERSQTASTETNSSPDQGKTLSYLFTQNPLVHALLTSHIANSFVPMPP